MLAGLKKKHEHEKQARSELLHLQRMTATAVINFALGFGGKKGIEDTDLHPIPELDPYLKKARKRYKQQEEAKREAHAEAVLEHHRKRAEQLKKEKEDA